MDAAAVVGFAVIAAALIAVPGPDWVYVLTSGSRDRVVLPAVGGLMIGYAILTLVVAVGIGQLAANSSVAMSVLTIGGAGYLMYLGLRTLRGGGALELDERPGTNISAIGHLARGVGVSALNPKGMLVFLSILPQFAAENGPWPLGLQLATLGAVFIAITAAFYLPLGVVAHRVIGASPRARRMTVRVAGTAMVVLAAALLLKHALAAWS